ANLYKEKIANGANLTEQQIANMNHIVVNNYTNAGLSILFLVVAENVTSVSPGGGYKKWDSKAQVWMNDEAAEAAARLREAEGTK
ncbi:hypothetical protein MJN76_32315, partial [Salmonella enterica subsp. enterica serovar Anatum]|nr:hypothetical protein [Salmonella enterica subsp. enterica serovar Anatum]